MNGNITPTTTGTYSLGSSDYRWVSGHFGNSIHNVDISLSNVSIKTSTTDGWARYFAVRHIDTIKFSIGAYGLGETCAYGYIGTSYTSTWIQFTPTLTTFNGDITASGNILIGTTKDWGFRMAVTAIGSTPSDVGSLGSTDGAYFGNITEGYGTAIWTTGDGKGHVQQGRSNGAATAYNLCLQELGGNVLIGTTSDNGAKLQVNGDLNGINYKLYNGTVNPRLELTDGTTSMYVQLYKSQMGVGPGSGKGIYITSGGNVLISTNVDSGNGAKLQVNGNISASGFIKSGSSDSYLLLGGGGHKAISDFLLKSEVANQELSNNLTTITKSLTVTSNWMDTGIKYTDLDSGTYIVQVSVNASDATGYMYSNIFSGVMSWSNKGTNDDESDEIILHRAGVGYGKTIYLRTKMSTSSEGTNLRLQIAASQNIGAAYTYTFKFKRVI